MSMALRELPDNVEALKALVHAQAEAHAAALAQTAAEITRHCALIESLQEQLRRLLAQRYGASSERLVDDQQLGLFNEAEAHFETPEPEEAESSPIAVPAHTRRRGGRAALPEALPRVEVVHDLPAADKRCPHDGTPLERIGEETSEQLDVIPAKVRVLRHVRLKYACPCCREHVRTAALPAQPLPKSNASPGLLAYVAAAKYADALPLYRQEQMFERIGVRLARATLASWMVGAGELVRPLIELLREQLVDQDYVQCDESTLQVLREPGRAAETKSYLWCLRGMAPERPVILFHYDTRRSKEVPKALLGDFHGYLQTDGYDGYHGIVAQNGLLHVLCFAHARRYFVDALKALGLNPKKLPDKPPEKARRTLKGLGFIRHLYAIEQRIRGKPPEERQRIRLEESAPVLEELRKWLKHTRPLVPPKTPLGEALGYLDEHWDGLNRFLADGRLEIDNNLCENAIRPFVVGRRNWLFSDTPAGAHASARLYSLIQTAKVNRLEPHAYLRRVFRDLPKATSVEEVERLLPWNLDPTTLLLDVDPD